MKLDTDYINDFYDKTYNWIIAKGPGIILGFVLMFVGLWLIRLFAKGMQKIIHRKNLNSSLQPFIKSLIIIVLRILLVFTTTQFIGIQFTFFRLFWLVL